MSSEQQIFVLFKYSVNGTLGKNGIVSHRPRIKYEYCVFCKNNGEAEEFFLSHTLKVE